MKIFAFFAACLFLAGELFAAGDPADILGLTLKEAYGRFGVPEEVMPVRGDDPRQDDVVFRYAGGVSLFWYRGRVWQVRLDAAFPGSVRGLVVGSSRNDVVAALGQPFHAEEDWLLYHFAGNGFPVRLRLFFSGDRLDDAYLYRGDF